MLQKDYHSPHDQPRIHTKPLADASSATASVGDSILQMLSILTFQGTDSVMEWNQGYHFKDTGIRMA